THRNGSPRANLAAGGRASLHAPAGLAIGPNGHLFVADAGNNRVLEFAGRAPNGASAIGVYGQAGFNSSSTPDPVSAKTLTKPQGLFVDQAANLYLADAEAPPVVVYSATETSPQTGPAASKVIGQFAFNSASSGGGAKGLNRPLDVALDSSGNILVADTGNNRVVAYPPLASLPKTGGAAYLVLGQH